jgi:hypothetical protein
VSTNWTLTATNIAPNQGDYSHLYAGAASLRSVWADGRGSTPDVFTTAIGTDFAISQCRRDTVLNPDALLNIPVTITNNNPLYANEYTLSLTSQRNWPLPSPSFVSVPASTSDTSSALLTVPDSAAIGTNEVCAKVSNSEGTTVEQCCFHIRVTNGLVAVAGTKSEAFALHSAIPNPAVRSARIEFALPRSSRARLRIYGLRGELVRTLIDGVRPAGPGVVIWDGGNNRGQPAPAGTYYYRLEAEGQGATRRMVLLR